MTLSELLELYQMDLETSGRAYASTARPQAKPLRAVLGERPIDTIDFATIETYKRDRKRAGCANATLNNELSLLNRCFALAVDLEFIKRRQVPRIKRLHVGSTNARQDYISLEELPRLLRHLREPINQLTQFAYFTGWRKGELCGLTWGDVDPEWVYCRARKDKRRKPKKVAHRGVVRTVIAERYKHRWVRGELVPWVFHREGRQVKSFHGSWRTACIKAGIPGTTFHSTRRSFARNAKRAGIPETVIMAIAGWSTRSIFDRYNITSNDDLEKAADTLQEFERTGRKWSV